MNTATGEGKLVCVTGGSGYIASWIVKFLLQRGYTVRATVREPSNPNKVEHLLKLDGAKERLQLFKADLLEQGSFDSAIQGCHGVFHTASPVCHDVKDPQVELIDPAVKGTLNVVKSCLKSPSVERVVLTSSMAAIIHNGRPRTPEVVVDETWFSNLDFLREHQMWYQVSKTSAEDAARTFLDRSNIDLIVINPGFTIGPLLQSELNSSASSILNLINGSKTFPNATFGWINVKDVANAHVQAYEVASASGRYVLSERVAHFSELAKILRDIYPTLQIPEKFANISKFYFWMDQCEDVVEAHIQAYESASASGRYCLAERVAHFTELAKTLHDMYPTFQVPEKCADDKPFMPTFQVSKEKAKSLGIEFIPLEVSLKETVESLQEKKFITS